MDETLWLVLERWLEVFWAVSARLISGSVVGWTTSAVQRDGRLMSREVAADGGRSGPRPPLPAAPPASLTSRPLAPATPRRPRLACSSLFAPRLLGDPMTMHTTRRRPSLEQCAAEQLRALAKPHRFGVRLDGEGFPVIPARYGQIEWF